MKAYLKTKEIKKLFAINNYSQNKVADKLGISSGYISQLICRARNPPPSLRKRILELFPENKFKDLFFLKIEE